MIEKKYNFDYSIGVTILRVLICFFIIKNMSFYLTMADSLFGTNAIFPLKDYYGLMNYYGFESFFIHFLLLYIAKHI